MLFRRVLTWGAADIAEAASNPSKDWTPSPVVSIDGVDVVAHLEVLSQNNRLQDPDSLYNNAFYSIAQAGMDSPSLFASPNQYPGTRFNVTFENRSTGAFDNTATITVDLTGVENGEDIFSNFIWAPASATASTDGSATTATSASSSAATSRPTAVPSGYPDAVVRHTDNYINGYYLSFPETEDAAVLSVSSAKVMRRPSRNFRMS